MELTRLELSQPLYGTVNVYRIGDTLVDTGHLARTDELRNALDGGALDGIDRVLLTHAHSDHVGGSQTLPELAQLPHVVYRGIPEIIHDFNGYLDRVHEQLRARAAGLDADVEIILDEYFPQGDYTESEIQVARVVEDGDTVSLGGCDCEVVRTPGHARRHMALYHAGSETMVTGDLVSPSGYFNLGPLAADVSAYKSSLERLQRYDLDRFAPGHGDLMNDPDDRLADAIEKTERAEREIQTAVQEASGRISARELAREAFGAAPTSVAFLTFVVCEYLEVLDADGILEMTITDEGVFARAKNGKQ